MSHLTTITSNAHAMSGIAGTIAMTFAGVLAVMGASYGAMLLVGTVCVLAPALGRLYAIFTNRVQPA